MADSYQSLLFNLTYNGPASLDPRDTVKTNLFKTITSLTGNFTIGRFLYHGQTPTDVLTGARYRLVPHTNAFKPSYQNSPVNLFTHDGGQEATEFFDDNCRLYTGEHFPANLPYRWETYTRKYDLFLATETGILYKRRVFNTVDAASVQWTQEHEFTAGQIVSLVESGSNFADLSPINGIVNLDFSNAVTIPGALDITGQLNVNSTSRFTGLSSFSSGGVAISLANTETFTINDDVFKIDSYNHILLKSNNFKIENQGTSNSSILFTPNSSATVFSVINSTPTVKFAITKDGATTISNTLTVVGATQVTGNTNLIGNLTVRTGASTPVVNFNVGISDTAGTISSRGTLTANDAAGGDMIYGDASKVFISKNFYVGTDSSRSEFNLSVDAGTGDVITAGGITAGGNVILGSDVAGGTDDAANLRVNGFISSGVTRVKGAPASKDIDLSKGNCYFYTIDSATGGAPTISIVQTMSQLYTSYRQATFLITILNESSSSQIITFNDEVFKNISGDSVTLEHGEGLTYSGLIEGHASDDTYMYGVISSATGNLLK